MRTLSVTWLIFLASFFVYQANLRPVASLDSLPTALLPFSILGDHTLQLDRFAPILTPGQTPYCLHPKAGHYYSNYSIAQSLLLTPLYIPIWAALHPERWQPGEEILLARICEKLMAGALAAASVAFFFLLLQLMTSRRNALLLTAAYAFATTTWAISSQALWQHSAGGLLIVLTLLALARGNMWPAGLCAGLALAVRPTDGLLACVVVAALLMRRTALGKLAAFLAPVIVAGFLTAAYNYWLFQDIRGYSGHAMSDHFLTGVAGVLFSPARGVVVYCPLLLFSLSSVWKRGLLDVISILFCIAHLAMIGLVPEWWGGNCWGPRLLTEMMPFLILMMVPAFDAVWASRWWRPAFVTLALYSIAIQVIGVFYYPNGHWDTEPPNIASRLWDWRDNPIHRTVRGGPVLGPFAALLEGALHGKAAALRKIRETGMKGF